MELEPFTGFSSKAVQFLHEWQNNNDRNRFQPRKSEYEELIKAPALSFIQELGNKLKLLSRGIEYGLRTNGSLLRIYRDVRFSQDKRPYNPNLCFQHCVNMRSLQQWLVEIFEHQALG